jgi:hypothetical protein
VAPAAQPAPSGYAPQGGNNPYAAPGAYGQAPAGYAAAPVGYGAPVAGGPNATISPAAQSLGRRGRIPAFVKFGVLALVLVVVGSGILRAVQGSTLSTSTTRCVYSCAPATWAVQPVANTVHFNEGFSFAYPGGWKPASSVSGFLANFSSAQYGGEFLIGGGSGTPALSTVLGHAVQRVSGVFQDFTSIGSLPGSRLGDQPGAGAIYSGFAQNNGQQIPVRVVFITAEQSGHWASFTGISPLNTNALPTGVNDGSFFDDVITQWTWNQ